MYIEILKKCSFGVVAYDTTDLANAFTGSSQQPACMVHSGYQQLLAEVHIVVFLQHSGKLPLGNMQRFCQLLFRAVAGHVVLKKGVDHIGAPVCLGLLGAVAGGVADAQGAECCDHQLHQQRWQQISGEGPGAGQFFQNAVAQLKQLRRQLENDAGGNGLPQGFGQMMLRKGEGD